MNFLNSLHNFPRLTGLLLYRHSFFSINILSLIFIFFVILFCCSTKFFSGMSDRITAFLFLLLVLATFLGPAFGYGWTCDTSTGLFCLLVRPGSAWLMTAKGVELGSTLYITVYFGSSFSISTVPGSGFSVKNDDENSSSLKMFALYGMMIRKTLIPNSLAVTFTLFSHR